MRPRLRLLLAATLVVWSRASVSPALAQSGLVFPQDSPTISVNGIEVLRTTTGKQVGISNSNPAATLSVGGEVMVSNTGLVCHDLDHTQRRFCSGGA